MWKISVNDRYAAVRKQRLSYGSHTVSMIAPRSTTDRYTQKNQIDEGNQAVNVSVAPINQSSEVASFLQIVPVSRQSVGNRLNTYALLDRGSRVSFIEQNVQEKIGAQGTEITLSLAGIQGWQDLRTETVLLKKGTMLRCIQSNRLHIR